MLTSNSGRASKVPASQSTSFLLHCACYTQTTPPTVERAAAGAARAIEEHSIAMQLAIGCYNRSTQEKLLLQETEVNLTNFQQIMEADETAAASKDESAKAVCAQLTSIFAELGPPTTILMDNGTVFCSNEICQFMKNWDVELDFSCAYQV